MLKEATGRIKDANARVRKNAISLINKIIIIYSKIFQHDKFFNIDEINDLISTSENLINEYDWYPRNY